MPYSFTQIEKDKSSRIGFVFLFLIVLYFLVSLLLYWTAKFFFMSDAAHDSGVRVPVVLSLGEIVGTFICAAIVGGIHWLISVSSLVGRILGVMNAQPANPQDQYHKTFINIVEEVSVATGGVILEPVVLPSPAMNAFALADFSGRKVIGVTEGLLSKLNRAQLEAVIGHEAAHVVSGDCLETTVTTSLFDVYKAVLATFSDGFAIGRRSKAQGFLIAMYFILHGTVFISSLFKMFISRQREFRADAVAVRLTRDPLSLAEALYVISHRWRGYGMAGDGMDAIFIVSPEFKAIEEDQGVLPDLFATHPPVEERLAVLLDMAHSDMAYLEEKFKEPAAGIIKQPVPDAIHTIQPQQPLWKAFRNGRWEGPFGIPEMIGSGWIVGDTFVNKMGSPKIVPFYQDEEIKKYHETSSITPITNMCPRCVNIALGQDLYKGAPVLRCSKCTGILMKEDDVQKILIREDYFFSDDIRKEGDLIAQAPIVRNIDLKSANFLHCPICNDSKQVMLRNFFSLAYPIEVDRCMTCMHIWFDRTELEILQYLIEKNRRDPK